MRIDEQAESLWIYDTAQGILLDQRPSLGFVSWPTSDNFLVHFVPASEQKRKIGIWSLRDRKVVGTIGVAIEDAFLSRAGGHMVVKESGAWSIWGIDLARKIADLPVDRVRRLVHFPGGNKWAALACGTIQEPHWEIRDLRTGRLLGEVSTKDINQISFSPDGRFCAIRFGDQPSTTAMMELPRATPLWNQTLPPGADLLFSADGETLYVYALTHSEMRAYESSTGTLRTTFVLPGDAKDLEPSVTKTTDGRFLLIHRSVGGMGPAPWWSKLPGVGRLLRRERNDTVLVLDMNRRRERFRLHGWNTSSSLLSDDGRTLVTAHFENDRRVLRCWDVDAWKPLHLPIGVPAGLGAVVVLLLWWRGRLAMVKNTAGG